MPYRVRHRNKDLFFMEHPPGKTRWVRKMRGFLFREESEAAEVAARVRGIVIGDKIQGQPQQERSYYDESDDD